MDLVLPVGLSDVFLGTLALVLAASGVLYWYSTNTFDTFARQGILGPKPLPFIGNLKDILQKDPAEWQLSFAQKFGKIYGIYIGRSPVLVVADPALIKEITIKDFHSFTNRRTTQSFLQKPMDRLLTALTDDHWKHVRAAITPVFTSGKLKQMMPTISDCAKGLSLYLSKKEGEDIDVKEIAAAFSMDVIAGTAFGLDVRSLDNPKNKFLQSALEFFSFANKKSLKTTLVFIIAASSQVMAQALAKIGVNIFDPASVAYIEGVLKPLLKKQSTPGERKNFVQFCADQLVDLDSVSSETIRKNGNLTWTTAGLLADDITSNAIVFILAGYETTSSLLTVFFYAMAQNVQVQDRLYQDLLSMATDDGVVTYEELKETSYLDWCINETLRMYTPAARIDRLCGKSTKVGNVHVSAGMGIFFPVYAIHHDPTYWPEPEVFRPERFSPEESRDRPAGAYIPFGLGPRNCIGMRLALLEAKVAIFKILSSYAVQLSEKTPSSSLRWRKGYSLLVPQDPIALKFVKRQS